MYDRNEHLQDVATLHVWESIERYLKTCKNADKESVVNEIVGATDMYMSREVDLRKLRVEAEKAFDYFKRA